MKCLVLLLGLILCWPAPRFASERAVVQPIMADNASVATLLTKPSCLGTGDDPAGTCTVKDLNLPGSGVTIHGQLYLPSTEGKFPVVILVPGGFNETDLIMMAPRYYAPRFASCGFAAYVFYKRGTGPSGGIYADATYDDFIDDVVSIAEALAKQPNIDTTRIGLQGGSSGALIAAVAAARSSRIAFVIGCSGPIVSWEEETNYNMEHALLSRGFPDSLVQMVMPLWRRYNAAWAHSDTAAQEAIAAEIHELKGRYDPAVLPAPYHEFVTDSSFAFMWPRWRSAQRDYLSELKHLKAKWLCIYGENDDRVPVSSCVRTIKALTKESGSLDCTIVMLPGVDHSFVDPRTGSQVPVIRIMVNWLTESGASNQRPRSGPE